MLSIADALPDSDPTSAEMVAAHFPDLPCPYAPCGGWVAVQDMTSPERIGRLIMPDTVRDMDEWRQTIGRIVIVGPVAGWDEITNDFLPSWPWFEPGAFVKLSAHASNRWAVEDDKGADGKKKRRVVFRLIWWKDIAAKITSVAEILR